VRQLSLDDVEAIHSALVQDFAGTDDPIDPPGVRDMALLESALGRQTASFGGYAKYTRLEGIAASLFYGLCMNHPFHNGNKRTALVTLLCFLDANNRRVESTERDMFELVTSMAGHHLDRARHLSADEEVDYVNSWLSKRVYRRDTQEYTMRFRELRPILSRFGCTVTSSQGGFIRISRDVDGGTKTCKTPYDGESREMPSNVIKKIRSDLELNDEHGVDSGTFYAGDLRADKFINEYRQLLRSLARV
jgi:death-on-curing protein